MQISVAYAEPKSQYWQAFDVPEGSTVMLALEQSGILEHFPEIDLSSQKVGIFGKVAKLDKVLEPGDRVEVYRPITADPETVPRRDEEE